MEHKTMVGIYDDSGTSVVEQAQGPITRHSAKRSSFSLRKGPHGKWRVLWFLHFLTSIHMVLCLISAALLIYSIINYSNILQDTVYCRKKKNTAKEKYSKWQPLPPILTQTHSVNLRPSSLLVNVMSAMFWTLLWLLQPWHHFLYLEEWAHGRSLSAMLSSASFLLINELSSNAWYIFVTTRWQSCLLKTFLDSPIFQKHFFGRW